MNRFILIPAFALTASLHVATALSAEELHVGHGWMAETDKPQARAFFEIENEGSTPVTITGFSTDLGDATLTAPSLTPGADPQEIARYTIAPGEALALEPEGLYLALTGLSAPLPKGEAFEILAQQETGDTIAIEIDVEGPNAESDSHAGHDH